MRAAMRDGLLVAMKVTGTVKRGYEKRFNEHLGGEMARSGCGVCTEFQGAIQACEDVLSDVSALLKAKKRRSAGGNER